MAKVLLVDDHPDFCEALAQLLMTQGHRVEVCASGEDAQESMNSDPPLAVIADDRLPGMSGLDLLHAARQDPRFADIPFIICSAAERSRDDAIEAGATDFWLKGSDSVFDAVEQLGERLRRAPTRT